MPRYCRTPVALRGGKRSQQPGALHPPKPSGAPETGGSGGDRAVRGEGLAERGKEGRYLRSMGMWIILVVGAPILAIITAWATDWDWTAASAIFTAIMTGATAWMAWEARKNRTEAIETAKRQAFKAALVEIADRNQVVVKMLKGLSAKGKLMRECLIGDVQSVIEHLHDYPETVALLYRVDLSATSFYVLNAVRQMKDLVTKIEEELIPWLNKEYRDDPPGVALRRLKYLHLILVQLGRVLVVEARKQKINETQEWEGLLEPSFIAGDLKPDEVSGAVAVYPPLGELRLPRGKEYEGLSFAELVKEAKNKKPEPADSVLGIRER